MSPSPVRCGARSATGWASSRATWSGSSSGHNFALKGLRPLIDGPRRASSAQIPSGRPIHLLVCGGGDPDAYVRMASRLGLRDHVHFLGFYPDIRDAYWSSDFFVQPTYYDPCSLVVLEPWLAACQ